MSMDIKSGRESLNPANIIKTVKHRITFSIEHPDYFDPDGLTCFVGAQGSGKTLSAVNYVYKLLEKYSKAKLVTNLMLKDYPAVTFDDYLMNKHYIYKDIEGIINNEYYADEEIKKMAVKELMFNWYMKENRVFPFVNNDDFKKYENAECGVIFLVDEIQLYLNSLESKNINLDVVTQISQQRKQRKHIVATSQVFGRMAKPLREQFSNVVVCKCYANIMQNNALVDRDSLEGETSSDTQLKGKVKKRFLWWHSPIMYKRYDTYYVIERGKFVEGEKKKGDIYDNRISGLSGDN